MSAICIVSMTVRWKDVVTMNASYTSKKDKGQDYISPTGRGISQQLTASSLVLGDCIPDCGTPDLSRPCLHMWTYSARNLA